MDAKYYNGDFEGPWPPKSEVLKELFDEWKTEAAEAGHCLDGLASIADERKQALVVTRSPRGAWVVHLGGAYLAEHPDATVAMRTAIAKAEGR